MKLLLVGADYIWSIERYFLKYILEVYPETELFGVQNLFYDYLDKSIANKILNRLGFTQIYHSINTLLLEKIEEFKPECIWVFKGMEVLPATLLYARRKGIKLINYNPDSPFIFSGIGSGNKYVTEAIKLYDLHFTYSLEIQQTLRKEYGKTTEYLPFGFDLDGSDPTKPFDEIVGPCFLGNPDKERAKLIAAANSSGISFALYGNNWKEYVSSKKNKIYPAVYGPDFWETLQKYRVQVNVMRMHNLNSHNMRTFEIPAIGGIELAPETPEHSMFFKNGEEIMLYRNPSECIDMIRKILHMSDDEAHSLRSNALNRSDNSGYTYKDRALCALGSINKCL